MVTERSWGLTFAVLLLCLLCLAVLGGGGAWLYFHPPGPAVSLSPQPQPAPKGNNAHCIGCGFNFHIPEWVRGSPGTLARDWRCPRCGDGLPAQFMLDSYERRR